jgi:hypothetical protein
MRREMVRVSVVPAVWGTGATSSMGLEPENLAPAPWPGVSRVEKAP